MRKGGFAAVILSTLVVSAAAEETDWLTALFADGDWSSNLRLRFEQADDNLNKVGNALTLRVTGKFESATVRGWQLVGEFENTSPFDAGSYNDGGANGATDYAVIADGRNNEFNQAYTAYSHPSLGTVKVGRHKIGHRALAEQRHVGSVSWRQNEQTYDGVTHSFSRGRFDYQGSIVHNVNRIFGEHNPLPNRADYALEAVWQQLTMNTSSLGDFEVYAYVMDFENVPALSRLTVGSRWTRLFAHDKTDIRATLEYASQKEAANNLFDVDVALRVLEGSVTWKGNERNILVKVRHETLTGDGVVSFRTPLATLHAMNGWADKFLATPVDGLVNTAVTVGASIGRAKVAAVFHNYEADQHSYGYGSETDLLLTASLVGSWKFGAKFAMYEGDANARNKGTTARDVTKFWTWVQFEF